MQKLCRSFWPRPTPLRGGGIAQPAERGGPDILVHVPQTRPDLRGRPVALFVFSNLREQKGGLTKAWLRRLAVFHDAGWDTHIATIHPQPEIDTTLDSWRARGWLPGRTAVHHYQRRNRRFRPSWTRRTDRTFTRDDRIADWLDWLVGCIPGVVVFADSPVTYAPVAKMRNPYVGKVMTVHLAHRGRVAHGRAAGAEGVAPTRSIYQGPAGTPKLSGRFLPYAASADAVVAPTRRQAEHLEQDVPGLEVTVIPNMLDPVDLREPPERDPMLVVQLGRLDAFKRIDHAIRAVARARRDLPDLHLAVYGRGPDLDRLLAVRDELGLAGVVTFEGFTDEPLRVLASAGASLMTSRREGFGLALAESLAVGTPVVSYDIDYGPAELVTDGVTGRLVRSGSVGAMASALIEVLADRQAWSRLSAAGPGAVEALNPGRVGRQWLDLAGTVAGGIAVPGSALLVEDLRVRRDGLAISAVALGTRVGRAPAFLGIEGLPGAAVDLRGDDAGGEGATFARDVTATLDWVTVSAWPVGASLRAADRGDHEIRVVAPGLPTTVAPAGRELVVVAPDSEGVPRRAPVPRAVVDVQPTGARARVAEDVTVVTDQIRMRARLRGLDGDPCDAELTLDPAGLVLDDASVIPVTVRLGDDVRQVGVLRPGGRGGWIQSRWVTPARVQWDESALHGLAAGKPGPMPVSLGLGRSLRSIGRFDFAAARPLPLRVGGRWVLAPRGSGRLLLIPGLALRTRATTLVRHRRAGAGG